MTLTTWFTNWSSIIGPKYTPAITIVEECNKAEIGVGAGVAFNDRLKKGNWADLEKIIAINEIIRSTPKPTIPIA